MGAGELAPPHTEGTSAALMEGLMRGTKTLWGAGPNFDRLYHKLKVLLLLTCNYTMRFIGYDSIKTRKTHVLLLSNSHNSTVSMQKNRGDVSHCVIVALSVLI